MVPPSTPTQTSKPDVGIRLDGSVSLLPKVGPAISLKLQKLGIRTVRDLIFHWPRTWLDATNPEPIASIKQDQTVVLEGQLSDLVYEPPVAKRRPKITGQLTDSYGGTIPVVWHNQSFLRRVLSNGQQWVLIGKAVWSWQSRRLELSNPQRVTERAVLAIYPETSGISSGFLRTLIQSVLDLDLPDPIGAAGFGVNQMSLSEAVRSIHRPDRLDKAVLARGRLALDELVMVQWMLLQERIRSIVSVPPITPAVTRLQELVSLLPFQLTTEQRRVSWSIIQQLSGSGSLRHVLQGDVGTGKTVVGLLVAISVLEAGHDVCWMAPTQLLSRQLRDRLVALCASLPYDVELVTALKKPGERRRPTLYVGTQALVGFFSNRLAPLLVIIDEQHRFGVGQQEAVAAHACHVLTMTATPIPRSLLLALYGERGSSQLTTRPVQQIPVQTVVLDRTKREEAVRSLELAVGRGEQGFIVTPRIEAGDDGFGSFPSLRSVMTGYQRLLPVVRFAAYHGSLSERVQQETMEAFMSGSIDVLVATSIIEVGLDVPNATQMLIEQADWFGLAQLHQLRGRVGRGTKPGACFVFHTDSEPPDRLAALVTTSNGFELAAMDLRLRGPGDLLGALQSGWGRLRLADPTDAALVQAAREIVDRLSAAPTAGIEAWLALYQEKVGKSANA